MCLQLGILTKGEGLLQFSSLTNRPNKLKYFHSEDFPVACNIIIINDTSRVIRMIRQLGVSLLMTLEVSFMLLVSLIMVLEIIYSTGVTHDDRH
jgi:hypothetical protein